eukprot:g27293.t1
MPPRVVESPTGVATPNEDVHKKDGQLKAQRNFLCLCGDFPEPPHLLPSHGLAFLVEKSPRFCYATFAQEALTPYR